MKNEYLKELGVFGYSAVEPIILASLTSGDPLLLVGKAGTGKTFLLNSLSEALGLEHRHYNASLIAFDDLVGFPWPDEKKEPSATSKRLPPFGRRSRSSSMKSTAASQSTRTASSRSSRSGAFKASSSRNSATAGQP